jgi:hypothetical protein
MLCGAAIYAELYPALKTDVLAWGRFGKITLPEILEISHWIVISGLIIVSCSLFYWFEKKGL